MLMLIYAATAADAAPAAAAAAHISMVCCCYGVVLLKARGCTLLPACAVSSCTNTPAALPDAA